jgi:hypothetical protein
MVPLAVSHVPRGTLTMRQFSSLLLGILSFVSIVGSNATVRAQGVEVLLGAAAGVLAGRKVDSILNEIDNKLEQLKAQFTGAGNELIASAAEQAYNSLKQLKAILASEREKLFENISNERKLALWDLYELASKSRQDLEEAFSRAAVQQAKLIAQVRFIGKDVGFLILRVGPTIITRQDIGQNPIRIFGVGFGVDQGDKKFVTTVSMNGKPLAKEQIERKDWGIELNVQPKDFNIDWNPSSWTYLPMTITSTTISQGSLWCRWIGWGCKNTYSAEYHLSL